MKLHVDKYIIVCLMFLWSVAAAAQSRCNVTGKVVDPKGGPVSFALVVLYDEGKIITGALTDDKGMFSLAVDQSYKELELSVEFIGYVKKVVNLVNEGLDSTKNCRN